MTSRQQEAWYWFGAALAVLAIIALLVWAAFAVHRDTHLERGCVVETRSNIFGTLGSQRVCP